VLSHISLTNSQKLSAVSYTVIIAHFYEKMLWLFNRKLLQQVTQQAKEVRDLVTKENNSSNYRALALISIFTVK